MVSSNPSALTSAVAVRTSPGNPPNGAIGPFTGWSVPFASPMYDRDVPSGRPDRTTVLPGGSGVNGGGGSPPLVSGVSSTLPVADASTRYGPMELGPNLFPAATLFTAFDWNAIPWRFGNGAPSADRPMKLLRI